MAAAIHDSARLHLDHICTGGDPFERGSARPLDFGHWSAHWLEMHSEQALLHGEAVAIGVAIDAFYAAQHGWLTTQQAEETATFLTTVGFTLDHPLLHAGNEDPSTWLLLHGLEEFRQHLGGALTIAMPDTLGKVHNCSVIDPEQLRHAITQTTQYVLA